MSKILLLILICAFPLFSLAQNDKISQLQINENVDSLKTIYGRHKHFLKEYELQSLIALSYYPELSNEIIYFKYANINSCAQTTMTLASIFKKTDKIYIVYLKKDTLKTGMILSDAPFKAQVAVMGHEFSHVVDFKSRGFFDLVFWAIRYLFVRQRTKIEQSTDRNTIQHGLGLPLYQWAEFFVNQSNADKHYRKMREKKYMHPDEILAYIQKLDSK